ncbi:ABC transporter ATP-binding protein [Chitinophaga sp. 30R24]|uniref:ABC transporter ATP-binding protein n=1 Tax=Chitinophaga sp. 30R24 TaxID=3248838 RepID=UPI003B914C0B
MTEYLKFLKKYKTAFILAPLLVVVDVIGEIVQPQLMSQIVDQGIQHKNIHYVIVTGGIMLILSFVAIVGNVGNIYYSSKASVGFAAALRSGLFKKIQTFSFLNIDHFSSASLVTRLTNDVNIIQTVVMMSLRLLIRGPLMLIFGVIMAARINSSLAFIIAIAIPVLGLSIFFILQKGFPYFVKMQQKLDMVNAAIQENLINIRVVKSFVRESFEENKFAIANNDLRNIAIKASGIVVMVMPVMMLVMNISIVAVVWFGGRKIIAGTMQIGHLMSFITYITQILMSLTMLSMTIMTFSRAGASSDRILEVLNTTVDIQDSPSVLANHLKVKQGKVEFKGVSFKYHPESEEYVLKDINFIAQPGEQIAIIGATGSAKSTLVQLIPRLYDVTKGQVLIDNIDVRDYSLNNLRSSIGMVLQKNQLFSGTIKDNLKWGNPLATDDDIIRAAKDAQAHDFIMSFPKQYETILGQGGVNLSGGQKQRICIAAALIKQPNMLILDDSTSAVDSTTEMKIRDAFQVDLKQVTLFIIAQRISSIQSADKIIILDNGEIVGMGKHAELMQSNKAYQEIYYSQQQKEENLL